METRPDFKTRMENLQAEINAAAKYNTTEEKARFLARHPILAVFGLLGWAGEFVVRAVFWVLIAAGCVLGIKCCWLAIVWLWELI